MSEHDTPDEFADGTEELTDGAEEVTDADGLTETALAGRESVSTTNGRFYVVPTERGHQLYAKEMDALQAFGDRVRDVTEVREEDQVREIEIGSQGENWVIRRLTWQDVARRLLERR